MWKKRTRKLAIILSLCLLVNSGIFDMAGDTYAITEDTYAVSGVTAPSVSQNQSVQSTNANIVTNAKTVNDNSETVSQNNIKAENVTQESLLQNNNALMNSGGEVLAAEEEPSDTNEYSVPGNVADYLANPKERYYIQTNEDFYKIQTLCADASVNGFEGVTFIVLAPESADKIWKTSEIADFTGIGTADNPFKGTMYCYYANGNGVQFQLDKPLFAHLGTGAIVRQMDVIADGCCSPIAENIGGAVSISDIWVRGTIGAGSGSAGTIAGNILDGAAVTLTNVSSTASVSGAVAGGLAGSLGNGATVALNNVTIGSGTPITVTGSEAAGGYFGKINGDYTLDLSWLSNVSTQVVGSASGANMGQLVGVVTGGALALTNGNTITANVSGSGNGGGLVGLCESGASVVLPEGEFTVGGSVATSAGNAGGLIGVVNGSPMELRDCTVTAAISGTYAGGVIGHVTASKNIVGDMTVSGTVKGTSYTGGILGQVTAASAVELQGTIDVLGIGLSGAGVASVVGSQDVSLIYFSENEGELDGTVAGQVDGTTQLQCPIVAGDIIPRYLEISNYGGVFRNQTLTSGEMLIGDGTLANVGVINNQITKSGEWYQMGADNAIDAATDLETLTIALYTNGNYGLTAFEGAASHGDLLKASYQLLNNADISYDLTGIMTINRHDQRTARYAFSGKLAGINENITLTQNTNLNKWSMGVFSTIGGDAEFSNLIIDGRVRLATNVGGLAFETIGTSLTLENIQMNKVFVECNNESVYNEGVGGILVRENNTSNEFTLNVNNVKLASSHYDALGKISSLIVKMDNATVNIEDVTLGGLLKSTGSEVGGFLGRTWTNTGGTIKNVTVEPDTVYDATKEFGALFHTVTTDDARLTLENVALDNLTVNMNGQAHCALLVQDAQELVLEVIDYDSSGCEVNNPGYDFDEIAAQSRAYASLEAATGIISIHSTTADFPDYHYENQVAGLEAMNNKYTMYFYDVFQRLEAENVTLDTTLDTETEVLLWDIMHYAKEGNVADLFGAYWSGGSYPGSLWWEDSFQFAGELDLSTISFYPVIRGGGSYKNDSTPILKFDASIMQDWTLNNTDTSSQHYGLNAGLFYNPKTIVVQNVTLTGNVANLGEDSGALVCGDEGMNGEAYLYYITLDDLWICDYSKEQEGPGAGLLISKIPGTAGDKDVEECEITLRDIEMTGYEDAGDSKAAAALIGSVGGTDVNNLLLDIKRMKIADDRDDRADGSHNGKVLAYASFIYNYNYTNDASINKGYGLYLFDEEFNSYGYVTYGEELDFETEFSDTTNKVFDPATDPAPNTIYKPYVYQVKKIEVNPKSGDILQGCGTYEDPYIIESAKQFLTLYRFMNDTGTAGNYQYESFYTGWKVIAPGDDSEFCSTKHSVVVNADGSLSGTGTEDVKVFGTDDDFPTPEDMSRAYYQLGADIDLTQEMGETYKTIASDFVGFGTATRPFVGVWYGKDTEGNIHTITLPDKTVTDPYVTYGFIQYAQGAVIKDLVIKTSENTSNIAEITGAGGGVIACINGGDNIIDNVTVVAQLQASDTTDSAAIGGYVGNVKKGGLILRNVSETALANFVVEQSTTQYFIGAVVGKVEDGFVIYEGDDSSSYLWTGRGGNTAYEQVSNYDILNGDKLLTDSAATGSGSGGSISGGSGAETPASGLEDGWYYIKNTNAQKYLQVTGNVGTNGQNVEIGTYAGSDGQKWYLENQNDGSVTLRSALGYMLSLESNVDGDYINITIATESNSNIQKFKLESTEVRGQFGVLTMGSSAKRGLTVYEFGTADGSNVIQLSYQENTSQLWEFEAVDSEGEEPETPASGLADGWYYIRNVNSGKYLQVQNNTSVAGGNVEIGTYSEAAGQKWYLTNRDDGSFTLESGLGFMLDVQNGSTADGTNIRIWTKTGETAQNFKLEETATAGQYSILTMASSGLKKLDVVNAGTLDGTNVQQWADTAHACQHWEFEVISVTGDSGSDDTEDSESALDDGWYYIKNLNAQMYLQVDNNMGAIAQNVEIGINTGAAGQKWYLTNKGDGTFTLKSGLGYMLNVENGSSANGANIQIWTESGDAAQLFKLEETATAGQYGILTMASNATGALDVYEWGNTEGSNVCQWTYEGYACHIWEFEPVASTGDVDSYGIDVTISDVEGSTKDKNITMNLKNAAALQIISMALNADALNICPSTYHSDLGVCWGYSELSRSRKANYDMIGNCGANASAVPADYVAAASYDNVMGYSGVANADMAYAYPYLYQYMGIGASDYLAFMNAGRSVLNPGETIDGIRYHVYWNLIDDGVVDMTVYEDAFRGIGALYEYADCFGASFRGDFDGNNNQIILDMVRQVHGTDGAIESVKRVGLFNTMHGPYGINYNHSIDFGMEDGSGDVHSCFIIKNFQLSGSIDAEVDKAADRVYAGGVAAEIASTSIVFENISVVENNPLSIGGSITDVDNFSDAGVSTVGGICANLGGNVLIRDCHWDGGNSTITLKGSGDAGGFIGYSNASAVIDNCTITNLAIYSHGNAGGMVGMLNRNQCRLYVLGTENEGESTEGYSGVRNAKIYGHVYTGGLVGRARSFNTLEYVFCEDATLSAYQNMGGIIGRVDETDRESRIDHAYVKNLVTSEKNLYNGAIDGIGGIIGTNYQTLTISNTTVTGDVTDSEYSTKLAGLSWKYRTASSVIGGIVGYHDSNILTLDNCEVTDISLSTSEGTSSKVGHGLVAGGLVGYNKSGVRLDGTISTSGLLVQVPLAAERSQTIMAAGGCFGLVQGSISQSSEAEEIALDYYKGLSASQNTITGKYAGGLIGYVEGANSQVRLHGVKVTNGELLSDEVAGGLIAYAQPGSYGLAFNEADTFASEADVDKNIISNMTMTGRAAGGAYGYISLLYGDMRTENITVENSIVKGVDNTGYSMYSAGGMVGEISYAGEWRFSLYGANLNGSTIACVAQTDAMTEGQQYYPAAGGVVGRVLATICKGNFYCDDISIAADNRIGLCTEEDTHIRLLRKDSDWTYALSDISDEELPGDGEKNYDALDALLQEYGYCVGTVIGIMDTVNVQFYMLRSNDANESYSIPVLAINPPVTDVGRYAAAQIQEGDSSYYRNNAHIIYGAPVTEVSDNVTGAEYQASDASKNLAFMEARVEEVNADYSKESITLQELLGNYRLSAEAIDLFEKTYQESYTFSGTDLTTGPILVCKAENGTIQDILESMTDIMTNVAGASASDMQILEITCQQKLTDGSNITDGPGPASITAVVEDGKAVYTSPWFDGIVDDKLSYTEITYLYAYPSTGDTYHKKQFCLRVFVEEPILYGAHMKLLEGRASSVEEVIANGIPEGSGTIQMANDSDYTLLFEYIYGKARQNMPETVTTEKTFSLQANNVGKPIAKGTRLLLIDVMNGNKAYYYTVESDNITEVKFSQFKDSEGNAYVNTPICDLPTVTSGVTEGGMAYYEDIAGHQLPDAGVEQFLLTVLSKDTSDQIYEIHTDIKPTIVGGTEVDNQNAATHFSPFDEAHAEMPYLSINAIPGLKIQLVDEETDISGILSREDGLKVKITFSLTASEVYWAILQNGGESIDSGNRGKYLELAFYLRDTEGNRVSLPDGTNFSYVIGDSNSENKVIQDNSLIYYYKDIRTLFDDISSEYQIGNINKDTPVTVEFDLNFAGADMSDITDENYIAWIELLRTANKDYPMGSGNTLDTYSDIVAAAAVNELGFAIRADDVNTLGINAYPTADTMNDIPYHTMFDFSAILDKISGAGKEAALEKWAGYDYEVQYTLYQKVENGENVVYEPYTENDIKLIVPSGEGTATSVDGTVTTIYQFTADEIADGNTNDAEREGLLEFPCELQVYTESLIEEDLTHLTNYKIVAELTIRERNMAGDSTGEEAEAEEVFTTDFFVFTVAKLKTDLTK